MGRKRFHDLPHFPCPFGNHQRNQRRLLGGRFDLGLRFGMIFRLLECRHHFVERFGVGVNGSFELLAQLGQPRQRVANWRSY